MSALKKRLVIYHGGGCIDGFTAAWAAWKLFGSHDTEYRPASYDGPIGSEVAIEMVKDRDVYIVDFSYARDTMLLMAEYAETLHVYDHHKTAQEALKGLSFATFDMDRSGAGLTWDSLHRDRHVHPDARPWLVDYVEDRDLWRFKLPQSKEVNAWLGVAPRLVEKDDRSDDERYDYEKSFALWDALCGAPVGYVAEKGKTVLFCEERFTENMARYARDVDFEGHRVPIVNTPYLNMSEVVGNLAEKAPFAVGWYQRADGRFSYSLRSRNEGVDVSEIAKKYGGGGHRNASGFVLEEMLPTSGSTRSER